MTVLRLLSHVSPLLLVPFTTGCMYLDVNIGYQLASAGKSSSAPPEAPEPDLGGGFSVGLGAGFYVPIADDKLRIAGGGEWHLYATEDVEPSYGAYGGRVQYALSDHLFVGGGAKVGSGSMMYGNSNPSARALVLEAGGGIRGGDSEGGYEIGAFLHHASITPTDESTSQLDSLSLSGVMLRMTGYGTPTGGSSSSSEEPSGDVTGWKIRFPDSGNVIPGLANGARRRGCNVDERHDRIIARCAEGNVVMVQQGPELLILCQQGMADQVCRSVVGDIAEHAK